MEYPTIVYRVPGRHVGNGCTYDYKGADDKEAFEALIAAGWFPTMMDAKEGKAAKDADPDRKALEAKARALGVSFNWKTPTAVLADKVAAAKVAAE